MHQLIDPIVKDDTDIEDDLEEYRKHLFSPSSIFGPVDSNGLKKTICGIMAKSQGNPCFGRDHALEKGVTCLDCVTLAYPIRS